MNIIDNSNKCDYLHMFMHLLNMIHTFSEQTQDVPSRLSQEVALATQNQTQLYLTYQTSNIMTPTALTSTVIFPVRFAHRSYGFLQVAPDPIKPTYPALPLEVIHTLAQICGLLLYVCEVITMLRGECQQRDYHVYDPLTEQERKVLLLISRGKTKYEIAEALSISQRTVGTHKQHIYQKLGVHCERDALLTAFQAGLFSPLEEM
jgi:DNA-binding CsgD family transcriptional regulator